MKKHGEDQPPKQTPDENELSKLANTKPKADQDTAYQNNDQEKGLKKDAGNKKQDQ